VPPPAMMNIAPNPGQFQQPRPQFLPPQQQAIETRNIYRGHHSRPEDTDRPASYCCEWVGTTKNCHNSSSTSDESKELTNTVVEN